MTFNALGESVHTSNWPARWVLATITYFAERIGLVAPSVRSIKVEKFSLESFLDDRNSRFTDLSPKDSASLTSYILENRLLEDRNILAKFGWSLEVALAFVARELARREFKISDEAKAYFDEIDNKFSKNFLSGIWTQAN